MLVQSSVRTKIVFINSLHQQSELVVADEYFRFFFEWTKIDEYSWLNNQTILVIAEEYFLFFFE